MGSQKTSASTNLTLQLVEHAVNTRYDDLPPKAVEFCKRLIMDTFGVAFPGSCAPGCREVVELLRSWGGTPVCSIFAYPGKIAPPFAALANSMVMHAMDFDDTLDESALHTFVSVLPAALAASEYIGCVDGKRLIESLVLGVDIICRISRGIRRPLSWIRTATCGSFGAAVAAGKLLNLNREQMVNALGIVYAQTSGNAQGLLEGRLIKRMQPGFASQAGVYSAFLAQSGITGSHQVLEGTYGFFNLYEHGDYDLEPILKNLGSHFCILDLSIKPYPCCRMTHASIDAVRELRTSVFEKMEEIHTIDVKVSKMVAEMVGKPFVVGTDPQVDAQFSIPYTIATMLLRGDVFLEDFETNNIINQKRKELAALVHVTADAKLPAKDLNIASVSIQMKNGLKYNIKIERPLGSPDRPIGIDGCREKFAKCVTYSGLAMDEKDQEKLLDALENIELLSNASHLIELVKIQRL